MKSIIKKKQKKAFTFVELLVVIAIIGILTFLAIVYLQSSHRNTRDSKRLADVRQMQTALSMYYFDNRVYPETLVPGEALASNSIVYMEKIPEAPVPADGDCTIENNVYTYSTSNSGTSYIIDFCIGKQVGELVAGIKRMTRNGIITPIPQCGDSDYTIADDEGNVYKTVKIGEQCWMAENLNIGMMITVDKSSFEDDTIEKYCYNNMESNCNLYGGLYQWNEAMNYVTTPESKGICPTGWHIPTSVDWGDLVSFINLDPNYLCNSGNAKALASNHDWYTHTTQCAVGNNQQTNNASGFNLYPLGGRHSNGYFLNFLFGAYYWSSSEEGSSAWNTVIHSNSVYFSNGSNSKAYGFPIRCLKNDE